MHVMTTEEWDDYDRNYEPPDYDSDGEGYSQCPECGGPVGCEPEDRSVGIMSDSWFCEGDEDCTWEG